ncbi:MAG: hypothetical protein ACPG6F_03880, partial [Flavobacteriaceae bacterium]
EVVDTNEFGAFLDWGIPTKHLFVPFKEQVDDMKIGRSHIVYIYLDEKTDRIVGSCRLNRYIEQEAEGFEAGQKVVVIEDLISTGKSSLNAVQALREAGCEVLEMLALFTYGFPQAATAFSEAKLDLTTLCDYPHLLEVAVNQEKISSTEVAKLSEWRQDPANWTP